MEKEVESKKVDSPDTLQVKYLVEIALSRIVSEIDAFFVFYAEIQDGRKNFCRNHSMSHCFRDKCVFAFYAEIQDGRQKWWESNFWEKSLSYAMSYRSAILVCHS